MAQAVDEGVTTDAPHEDGEDRDPREGAQPRPVRWHLLRPLCATPDGDDVRCDHRVQRPLPARARPRRVPRSPTTMTGCRVVPARSDEAAPAVPGRSARTGGRPPAPRGCSAGRARRAARHPPPRAPRGRPRRPSRARAHRGPGPRSRPSRTSRRGRAGRGGRRRHTPARRPRRRAGPRGARGRRARTTRACLRTPSTTSGSRVSAPARTHDHARSGTSASAATRSACPLCTVTAPTQSSRPPSGLPEATGARSAPGRATCTASGVRAYASSSTPRVHALVVTTAVAAARTLPSAAAASGVVTPRGRWTRTTRRSRCAAGTSTPSAADATIPSTSSTDSLGSAATRSARHAVAAASGRGHGPGTGCSVTDHPSARSPSSTLRS